MREKFYDPDTLRDTAGLGCQVWKINMMESIADLQNEWLQRENDKLVEKRRYPHFDPFVTTDDKRKDIIFSSHNVGSHSFFPLIKSIKEVRRRKWDAEAEIRKIGTKPRPICYAAHLDSLIFSWYGYLLNYWYGKFLLSVGLDGVVLAYRKLNRSTPDFVNEVGNFIRS